VIYHPTYTLRVSNHSAVSHLWHNTTYALCLSQYPFFQMYTRSLDLVTSLSKLSAGAPSTSHTLTTRDTCDTDFGYAPTRLSFLAAPQPARFSVRDQILNGHAAHPSILSYGDHARREPVQVIQVGS